MKDARAALTQLLAKPGSRREGEDRARNKTPDGTRGRWDDLPSFNPGWKLPG